MLSEPAIAWQQISSRMYLHGATASMQAASLLPYYGQEEAPNCQEMLCADPSVCVHNLLI